MNLITIVHEVKVSKPLTKTLNIILFLSITCSSFCQNLVPNSSFEEVISSSNRWSGTASKFDAKIKHWNSPTQGSPDLLDVKHLAEMFPARPLVDLSLYQPRTGNYMIGIKTYGCISRTLHCKEYIQVKLTEKLKEGSRYYFEYWVLPIEKSIKVNSFGLVVNNYELSDASILREIDAYPVNTQEDVIIGNGSKWQKVSGEFEAFFDAEYIIAGVFAKDEKMESVTEKVGMDYGYYLLDDFSIEEIGLDKKTFAVNEVFVLENIFFEFDKSELLEESFEELQDLASYLLKKE